MARPSSPTTPAARLTSSAWAPLARAAEIGPGERLLVALSGGADSVFLLHLLARARPRPDFEVMHVQHDLRGAASVADEAFCARLSEALEVPFHRTSVALDPARGSLEEQARNARYRALARVARARGLDTLLTAHQAEDVVETLLWRWIRGNAGPGVRGPKRRRKLPADAGEGELWLARPLLDHSRPGLRARLRAEGLEWREDASNTDPRFSRNRMRHSLLPFLEQHADPGFAEDLRQHCLGLEAAEAALEKATLQLAWQPLDGGRLCLARAELDALAPGLQRRALWRLLSEAQGAGPRGKLLDALLADLGVSRSGRHNLRSGWFLDLEPEFLTLQPPQPR